MTTVTGTSTLQTLVVLGQLDAFESIVADARLAPDLARRTQLTRLGLLQFAPVDHLLEGLSTTEISDTLAQALQAFHRYTPVTTWPQALVKAVVSSGMASDFLSLVEGADAGVDLRAVGVAHAEVGAWAREQLTDILHTDSLEADGAEASRLALFARRMLGEASAQAQRVAGRASALTSLLTGEEAGSSAEIEATSELLGRLVELSARRLEELGLQP